MTEEDRTGQDGIGKDRTGQDGTGQDRTGQLVMEQAMIFTFPFQSTKFGSGPDKTDGKGKSRTKIRKERRIR